MIEFSVFLMTNYLKPEDGPKAYAKNQVHGHLYQLTFNF